MSFKFYTFGKNQLTKEEAIKFSESEQWREMSLGERAKFQIQQKCLCMPFAEFHRAVEALVGRPVFTHEFADDAIKEEVMSA